MEKEQSGVEGDQKERRDEGSRKRSNWERNHN